MESRLNKYRKSYDEKISRSSKNQDMYNDLYNNTEYNDLEKNVIQVASNEVDLNKLREILKKEEEGIQIVKRAPQIDIPDLELEEEKIYDLKDILNKAKNEKEEEPGKLRSLENTGYNILKAISVTEDSELIQKAELKKMIDTVTNTSLLNKIGDNELSLGLLKDLESTTIVDSEKEELDKSELDKSFYTSSLGFSCTDFEELKDINTNIKKDNKVIKVLLIIILIFMLIVSGFIIYTLI